MNKEILSIALAFGCVAANAANVNYDLLGRKGSKMNSPMVYKNVDYSKMKKNNQQNIGSTLETKALAKQASGLKGGATAIVGRFGPKGYRFKSCSNTTGCGEKVYVGGGGEALSTYLKKANENFIPVASRQEPRFSPNYSFNTAGPTRSNLSGFDAGEFSYNVYGNVTHTSSFNKNLQITYSPVSSVPLGSNTLSKTNVGIYFDEEAVPVRLNPNVDANAPFIFADNASMNDFNSMPGYEMRASRMYRLVHMFSDLSAVYAAKGQPSNPADSSKGPQIYMGLHAYGGQAKSSYSTIAKNLDNYIYNNRTVDIVGAGNTAGNLSAKAFAVNAITVGAKDPITNKTASYSAKNLPKYCSNCATYNKPEVENYSNFYTNDYYRRYVKSSQLYEYYPYYDGTEAAAGITAGMISDMLSYNEFYKWHPEVVKAVVQNLKYSGKKFDYDQLVFDQKNNVHHSFYFIGDVNTLMKPYNSLVDRNGDWSVPNGTKEIRLSFDRGDLVNGSNYSYQDVDGFDISIAWLTSGNDIANLKALPQKFEILTYGHDGTASSMRRQHSTLDHQDEYANNSYRSCWVDGYYAKSNVNFTVRIILDEEDSRSENYGQMVLGVDIKPIFKYK